MDGWVKIHRKLFASAVWCGSDKLLRVWVWCLLRANFKPNTVLFEGEQLRVQCGEFITGRDTGSAECGLKPSTFWNNLKKLEQLGNIRMKSDNKKTLVALVNWGHYQALGYELDSNRTTNGHRQEWNNKNGRKKQKGTLPDITGGRMPWENG